jgi:hypothetical protein
VVKAFWKIGLVLVAALMAGGAQAQVKPNEPDPVVWLKQVYDLYHRAQTNKRLENQATTALIEKRSSKALAALFKKDADCSKKEQGVCALDWDFVIDGQDYKISNVQVAPATITGDKATVVVTFVNMTSKCRNVYSFVKEDGSWKVDDIEAKSGDDAPVSIAAMIRDFKP